MENTSISVADERKIEITDRTAESLSLGSALLGWMTIIFAFALLEIYPIGDMVVSVVFFCGFGFLMVAMTSWKKGNEFGVYSFGMIAIFCWAFAALNILPATGLVSPPTSAEVATFMITFALFVAMFCLMTTFFPVRLLTIVIGLASLMFMLVGIHTLYSDAALGTAIGVLAVIVGILASYLSVASVVNGCARKQLCPLLMKKV